MKKRKLIIMIGILLVLTMAVFGVNAYVTASTSDDISMIYKGGEIEKAQIEEIKDYNPQCVLVLGCMQGPSLAQRRMPRLTFSGECQYRGQSCPDVRLQYVDWR